MRIHIVGRVTQLAQINSAVEVAEAIDFLQIGIFGDDFDLWFLSLAQVESRTVGAGVAVRRGAECGGGVAA